MVFKQVPESERLGWDESPTAIFGGRRLAFVSISSPVKWDSSKDQMQGGIKCLTQICFAYIKADPPPSKKKKKEYVLFSINGTSLS